MTDIPTASDLRRWAVRCGLDAATAKQPSDRERLLKMRDAFLQLAENEAWLSGKPTADPGLESDAEIQALMERMVGNTGKTL